MKTTKTRLMELAGVPSAIKEAAAPLQQAEQTSLAEINPNRKYLVLYSLYSRGPGDDDLEVYTGSGASVLEFLKEAYDYIEWADEYQHDNGTAPTDESFIEYVEDVNGDGYSYTQLFEI